MTKEQSDDREELRIAVGRVVRDVANFPQAAQTRLLGQSMTTLRDALVDSVADAGFYRAAVPDAATDRQGGRIVNSLREAVRGERDGTTIPVPVEDCREIIAWRAERDAALAAVERVRAVLAEERAWLEHLVETGDAMSRNVIGIGKVEAALDGTPEPEWEYAAGVVRNGVAAADDEDCAVVSIRDARLAVSELNASGGRPDVVVVRRRKAGPWLPVGGESKP